MSRCPPWALVVLLSPMAWAASLAPADWTTVPGRVTLRATDSYPAAPGAPRALLAFGLGGCQAHNTRSWAGRLVPGYEVSPAAMGSCDSWHQPAAQSGPPTTNEVEALDWWFGSTSAQPDRAAAVRLQANGTLWGFAADDVPDVAGENRLFRRPRGAGLTWSWRYDDDDNADTRGGTVTGTLSATLAELESCTLAGGGASALRAVLTAAGETRYTFATFAARVWRGFDAAGSPVLRSTCSDRAHAYTVAGHTGGTLGGAPPPPSPVVGGALGSSGSFTVEGDPDDAAGAPPEELAVVATLVVRIPVPDAETATWLAEWGGQVLAEVLARALQATYAEAGVRPDWLVSGFFELLSVGSSPAAARRLTQADVGTGLGALAMGGVRLVFRSNDGGADPDAMTALLDALNVQLLSWIERLSAGDINTQWHTAVQVRDPEAPAVALDPVDVADTGLGQLVSVIDVPELQASEGGFSDEEGNGLAIWLLLPAGVIACLAVVATALCVLRPCVAGSVLLGRQADL